MAAARRKEDQQYTCPACTNLAENPGMVVDLAMLVQDEEEFQANLSNPPTAEQREQIGIRVDQLDRTQSSQIPEELDSCRNWPRIIPFVLL